VMVDSPPTVFHNFGVNTCGYVQKREERWMGGRFPSILNGRWWGKQLTLLPTVSHQVSLTILF